MSLIVRIVLIVVSFIASGYAVRKIRKSQMNIEGAMYWFLLSVLLLVLSIFPKIAIWTASVMNIESPVNLVFLVMLFLILLKLFSTSVKQSQLENKINMLTQEIAIRNHLDDTKDGKKKELKEESNE